MDTQKIEATIREFLEKLSLEVSEITLAPDDLHPVFMVQTPDSKKLIGNHGDNLRALNYVIKRIVERRLGGEQPNFMIDVNGYQESRNEEVRKKARILIERVRSFKTSVEMEPMNAYERMIVHSLAAEMPDIETESFGEGKVKKLVIRYKEPATDSF